MRRRPWQHAVNTGNSGTLMNKVEVQGGWDIGVVTTISAIFYLLFLFFILLVFGYSLISSSRDFSCSPNLRRWGGAQCPSASAKGSQTKPAQKGIPMRVRVRVTIISAGYDHFCRPSFHQVITQTITPLQVDVIDSDNEENGIKVLKHYFQLWGAPTNCRSSHVTTVS